MSERDPWDVAAGNDRESEKPDGVQYNNAVYTNDEARALAGWLADPAFALFSRMLEGVRAVSVERMDEGDASMDDAEDFVKHSAKRGLIVQIREMRAALEQYLAESVSVDR
jgi:hypothetical protein